MHYSGNQIWEFIPDSLPVIRRACPKCGPKSSYVNSRKFRLNANKGRVDIWMIFQCEKCKSTWNMTLFERISPRDIQASVYQKFLSNDISLIYKYAFDPDIYQKNKTRPLLEQLSYKIIKHIAEEQCKEDDYFFIKLRCNYPIEIRIDKLLSEQLNLSRTKIKNLIAEGRIIGSQGEDIGKARVKDQMTLQIKAEIVGQRPVKICYTVNNTNNLWTGEMDMDTLDGMRKAVDYIEANLDEAIEIGQLGKEACCSSYQFQRMFQFVAGIPVSEYIRRRRLTKAAFDLQNSEERIIDIAVRYGYQSPDAFTRAFQKMHQITPSEARQKKAKLTAYPRVEFSMLVRGTEAMEYRIETLDAFKIAGIKQRFEHSDPDFGAKIGLMWQELTAEIYNTLDALAEQSQKELLGVYNGMYEDATTDYYIAVKTSRPCVLPLEELEIPKQTWAVFTCTGPLPGAMAKVWEGIFTEWFPSSGYEHAEAPEIEWYSKGDMGAEDYQSEIWIPVVKKQ